MSAQIQKNCKQEMIRQIQKAAIDMNVGKHMDELVNGATEDIQCFYCMDITKVLHNRRSSWDSWDGHGDVDVVNCIHCVGNDKYVAVRHHESAQKEYPGILGRGANNDSNFLKEAAEGAIKAGLGKL